MSSPSLERAVSRWQIVALALNDVVGSGVYLLPAVAAAILGVASLGAVALAGLAVLLIVLCFAEASSHFDQPGSAYLYARTAFGELAGFQVGWMTWLTSVAAVASLSNGFALALGFLWPGAAEGTGRWITVTLALAFLTALNVVGVRAGAGAAVVLSIGKLVPLAIFVGIGIFAVSGDVLRGQPAGSGSLAEAALLLLFAYSGFENAPAAAGEYRDPRRDVPFALVLHIGLVTLLYIAVQAVALGTLPNLGQSQTPLADSARLFMGSFGGLLLTAGAAISILGTTGNTVFAGPRYLFALARDGFGPRILGTVDSRFRTPAAAIIGQTLVALPLALTGSFVELAALSVITRLVIYLSTALAVPVLRRKMEVRKAAFRLPGGLLIPVSAAVLSIAFASSATPKNLIAAGIAFLFGFVIYALRRRQPVFPPS